MKDVIIRDDVTEEEFITNVGEHYNAMFPIFKL